MKIIRDKQLIEDVYEYDVILYGMSINNSMNNGFSYDIALNFPEVKKEEDLSGYGDTRKYGKIHEVVVGENLIFCACYCYNVGLKKRSAVFIDYDDLKACLKIIAKKYKGKKIASPIIGSSQYDGCGDKSRIIAIYNEIFGDTDDVTIYDFAPQDYRKERYKEAVQLRKQYLDKVITKNEFERLRQDNEWRRLNGIFKKMPDDYLYIPRRKSKSKITIKK